ncbi:hypothetical protein BDS110ZK25_26010 [Bradyrhizobium diazoefficiens]
MGVLLALGFGVYYYSDTVFNYGRADEECIKFAEKADIKIALIPDPSDTKVFVAKKWIKGSNVVVELGQKAGGEKKGYYQSRLCVIGGGQIQIPSMFEQWQYR